VTRKLKETTGIPWTKNTLNCLLREEREPEADGECASVEITSGKRKQVICEKAKIEDVKLRGKKESSLTPQKRKEKNKSDAKESSFYVSKPR